jgi:hypothetical protein
MDPHVIVLDARRDREFLEQQRIDPVMKTLLEAGDRVVVCAHCRLVFREYTWAEIKGKFGHGTSTLPHLPVDTVHFSRSANREERPRATERAATTGAVPPPPEPGHARAREWQTTDGPTAGPARPSAAQQAWAAVVNSAREFANEAPRAASALFNGARRVVNEAPGAWSQVAKRTRQFSNRVRGRSHDADSSETEVLELKEIPFELEKIPFELREMRLY